MSTARIAPNRNRTLRACAGVVVGALVSLGIVAACGRSPTPAHAPRESLLSGAKAGGTFRSPAVWRYHPRSEAALLARQELSDGTILYAGERGERWLYHKKNASVRAAARLAPEALIAILHLDDGGWLFVGQSGTGYEAREPLGPFVRTSAPVDRLARVSAAGTSVVGVTREAKLVHSNDAGATWKPVGAGGQRFVDVMLADPKRGLALSVPEAIWETRDGGATYEKLDVQSFGALGLGWDDRTGVAIRTALGWKRWQPGASPPFSDLGRAPTKGRFKLVARPERGPDAAAILEGRAVVLEGQYSELSPEDPAASRRDTGGRQWVLWRGPVGGKLKSKPFDAASGCASVRLSGFGQYLYLACARTTSGANQRIAISRSTDGGKSFQEESYSLEGRLGSLAIAVGDGGALIVTGICPPHNTSRGCVPYGVHHRRRAQVDAGAEGGDAGKSGSATQRADAKKNGTEQRRDPDAVSFELAPSATPALKGSAMAIAFSPDGRTAFAVGRRTKSNSLVVFVSRDGGESFDAHELEELSGLAADDDTQDDRWSRPPPSPASKVASLGAGEDGTLAIVLTGAGTPSLVIVDEEGRVVALSRAPMEATHLGAIGTRAVAFSETTRMAWESMDGGSSWDSIGRLPAGTCRQDGTGCNPAVSCHAAGCVIGSEISRVGWHGQADDEQGVLAPPDARLGDIYDRKVRTGFACTLDEKQWQTMDGVAAAPTAERAAIGKVAWYLLTQDEQKASATVLHAMGGARPRIESVKLLAPLARATGYAFMSTLQVEGAAALRYSLPEPASPTLRNVEVVWDNILDGKLTRARVPDLGPARPGDYSRSGVGAQRAQPSLVSIASGGLYLRIHASARDDQPTVFLDGRQTASVPPVKWPHASMGARTEMAHVGSAHVPLLFIGPGSAVVRARRSGASWTFDTVATGLAEPALFGLTQARDLTYQNGRAGLSVLTWDPDGQWRSNLLFPFRAEGPVVDPPIALPTQLDAGDKPARCGSVHRSDTPRVIAPFQAGTRHPILVTDPLEPLRVLLTGQAVMHGSAADPCVAAFDAEVVPIDPTLGAPENERAILPLDDLDHSWLFRSNFNAMGEGTLEYRLMSCRFDPTLEPPPEVFGQPGTKVRRTR